MTILKYSEPWHIYKNRSTLYNHRNPKHWHIDLCGIFRTLKYLKPNTYSELSKRFKMECFAKIVKSYNHFSNMLYLSSLARFWIRLFLNKYLLTCRVTSHYVLYKAYSEPCLYKYNQYKNLLSTLLKRGKESYFTNYFQTNINDLKNTSKYITKLSLLKRTSNSVEYSEPWNI